MSSANFDEIKKQLSGVVGIINPIFVGALLQLQDKLSEEDVEWAVGGKLGEALRVVQVEPDSIDVVTTERGANQILQAIQGANADNLTMQMQRLSRDALINESSYPVYMRSYSFAFSLGQVRVKVYGDIQLKVDDWEWGDKLEFTPEHVYVAGVKIGLVPLQLKFDIYNALGWVDSAEKIGQVLQRKHRPSS